MPANSALHIDTSTRTIQIGGETLNMRLSRQEFDLLSHLFERRGEIVPREELADRIWGSVELDGVAVPRSDDHMLHALVHRVRTKFRNGGADLNRYLTSVPGVGYRLDPEPAGAGGGGGGDRRVLYAAAGGAGAAVMGVVAAVLLLFGGDDDDVGSAVLDESTTPGAAALVGPSSTPGALCGSEMIAPAPGTTLSTSDVRFEWTEGCGMTKYDIWVGCSPTDDEFLNPDDGPATSAMAHGVPLDGGPVFVQLVASDGTEEGTFIEHYEYETAAARGSGTAHFLPGTTDWLDTQISLEAGQSFAIDACGQIQVNSTGNPVVQTPGDDACAGAYRFGFPAPELPCWSLMGRIGDGAAFLVGSELASEAETSGRLYLGVNDDNLTDNGAGFRATVQVSE